MTRCNNEEPVFGHALRAVELHRLDAAIYVEVLDRAQSLGSHAEHLEVMILANDEIQDVGRREFTLNLSVVEVSMKLKKFFTGNFFVTGACDVHSGRRMR